MRQLVKKFRRETKDFSGSKFREEVFSKSVRAGKRTYFFDVKSTRGNELYLTITESKMLMGRDEEPVFEKHKIFLYREDFEKFKDGLTEVLAYINSNQPADFNSESETLLSSEFDEDSDFNTVFSNVDFDDLSK